MSYLYPPEAFSIFITVSRNRRNERILIFATIEPRPKVFMLNLHNLTIEILGRIKN